MFLKIVTISFTLAIVTCAPQNNGEIQPKRFPQHWSKENNGPFEAIDYGPPPHSEVGLRLRRGPPGGRGPPNNRGPPNGRGPPNHRGPPYGMGPADYKGSPDGQGPTHNRGPPVGRGPPDHRGPPDGRGPPDFRGPPNTDGRPLSNNTSSQITSGLQDYSKPYGKEELPAVNGASKSLPTADQNRSGAIDKSKNEEITQKQTDQTPSVPANTPKSQTHEYQPPATSVQSDHQITPNNYELLDIIKDLKKISNGNYDTITTFSEIPVHVIDLDETNPKNPISDTLKNTTLSQNSSEIISDKTTTIDASEWYPESDYEQNWQNNRWKNTGFDTDNSENQADHYYNRDWNPRYDNRNHQGDDWGSPHHWSPPWVHNSPPPHFWGSPPPHHHDPQRHHWDPPQPYHWRQPPPHHGPPPPHHGPPPPHHGPTPPHHGPPPPHHGPPPPHYVPPPPHHGPPPPHHGPPPPHHGPPQPHHGPPPPHHGPPPHHWGPPPHSWGLPPHHHGPPPHDCGPPPQHWGPQWPNHNGPPPHYWDPPSYDDQYGNPTPPPHHNTSPVIHDWSTERESSTERVEITSIDPQLDQNDPINEDTERKKYKTTTQMIEVDTKYHIKEIFAASPIHSSDKKNTTLVLSIEHNEHNKTVFNNSHSSPEISVSADTEKILYEATQQNVIKEIFGIPPLHSSNKKNPSIVLPVEHNERNKTASTTEIINEATQQFIDRQNVIKEIFGEPPIHSSDKKDTTVGLSIESNDTEKINEATSQLIDTQNVIKEIFGKPPINSSDYKDPSIVLPVEHNERNKTASTTELINEATQQFIDRQNVIKEIFVELPIPSSDKKDTTVGLSMGSNDTEKMNEATSQLIDTQNVIKEIFGKPPIHSSDFKDPTIVLPVARDVILTPFSRITSFLFKNAVKNPD